jgi:hypothetical protein
VTSLVNAGYTAAGQTIIIIDSFGIPAIVQDLKIFDAGYGLPIRLRLLCLRLSGQCASIPTTVIKLVAHSRQPWTFGGHTP